MGKPAARTGDMTAHGGTITGPGCLTVLIGGMPAACVGDMHTCPMATPGTPPIPHVGGPITLGSTGVRIGGKPAARMGDMAVCVGPPSSIILGCMTVLIGEAGGGGGSGAGGGGAGAGGGSAAAGAVTSAAIAGQAPQTNQAAESYLDVSFEDKAKLPIAGIGYELKDPDGAVSAGVLGGQVKRTGVPQGSYDINLRGIVNAQWSTRETETGKAVDMVVDTVGVDNGEKATIDIFVRDSNFGDQRLASQEAEAQNNQVKSSWTMEVDEKYLKICDLKDTSKHSSRPFFFFKVAIKELTGQSCFLYYKDKIEIELKDPDGNALANKPYTATLPIGEIIEGKSDGQGKVKIENMAPGRIKIKFNKK
jgi:uncharacterized Zn-binding protein involved in type VI secretion